MSRPRRLPPTRLVRIGGWTAVATAGAAALLSRFSGGVTPSPAIVGPPPAAEAPEVVSPLPALPAMPSGGLLVLYLSPTPGVPAAAVTPTTAAPAPAPAAAPRPVPAPPPVTSSGS